MLINHKPSFSVPLIPVKTMLFHTLLPAMYPKLVEIPTLKHATDTSRHGEHRSVQYMSVYVRILLIACVMYEPKWTDAVHRGTYVGSRLPSSARYFVTGPESGLRFYQYVFAIDFSLISGFTLLKSPTCLLGIKQIGTNCSKLISYLLIVGQIVET